MSLNPTGTETRGIEGQAVPATVQGKIPLFEGTTGLATTPKIDATTGGIVVTSSGGSATVLSLALISASASGDNTIIAAVPATTIKVYHINFITADVVNVRFKSGAGTNRSGLYTFIANQGIALDPPIDNPVVTCVAGDAFVINLSSAVAIGGFCLYTQA